MAWAGTADIEHVVVLVKENATFDHYFGRYPGVDGVANLKVGRPWYQWILPFFPTHGRFSLWMARHNIPILRRLYAVKCQYTEKELGPYWELARTSTIKDRHFSEASPSDGNHIAFMTGTKGPMSNNVWLSPVRTLLRGKTIPSRFLPIPFRLLLEGRVNPPLDLPSVVGQLTAAGIDCANYGNHEAPYIKDVGEADAAGIAAGHGSILRQSGDFVTDVHNGQMPKVSWVTAPSTFKFPDYWNSPNLTEELPYHIGDDVNWTMQQLDAIKKAGKWDKTLVILVWDDWGGYYDHVQPPSGLGPRVPMIVTGGAARVGAVSSDSTSAASIVATIEDVFNLPRLAATVDASNLQDAVAISLPGAGLPRSPHAAPSRDGAQSAKRAPVLERQLSASASRQKHDHRWSGTLL